MDVKHDDHMATTPEFQSTQSRYGKGTAEDRRTSVKRADRAFELIGDQRAVLTDEDNKRIRRKTDRSILIILIWVYFLQILDKSVLGYGATFGLQKDTVSRKPRSRAEVPY